MPGEREYDVALFGATGFTGGLTADYLAANAPDGLRWALVGRNRAKLEAVAARLAAADPAAPGAGPARGRRRRRGGARQGRRVDQGRDHHGRSLRALRRPAGRRLRRRGHRLRRPHRRARVRRPHVPGEPRGGASRAAPGSSTAAVSTRSRTTSAPISPSSSCPRACRSPSTATSAPTRSSPAAPTTPPSTASPADGRRSPPPASAARPSHAPRAARSARRPARDPPRRGPRRLDRPAADHRRRDRPPLRRRGRPLRPRLHLRPPHGRPPPGDGRRRSPRGSARVAVLAPIPPARKLLLKAKSPGDGPDEATRAGSWFKVRFVGEGGGKRVVTEVSGGDPGYSETSKMLAECGLCLAFDDLPPGAGQLTTVASMGDMLLTRLEAAGIRFRVLESG